jgi:hypothetical protein
MKKNTIKTVKKKRCSMNQYQRQNTVRNHYNGNERNPEYRMLQKEISREINQSRIERESFSAQETKGYRGTHSAIEISQMPYQASDKGDLEEKIFAKQEQNRKGRGRTDNSRHRNRFQTRISLKSSFIKEAYQEWTNPFFGQNRIE